jgi:hypothetical protein
VADIEEDDLTEVRSKLRAAIRDDDEDGNAADVCKQMEWRS